MFLIETEDIKDINIKDTPIENLLDVFKVCKKLEILCEREKGLGVSAIQAGIPWKLFIIKGDGTCELIEKDKYSYFVNCNYFKHEESNHLMSLEGCLSIRSADGRLRFFQVERHEDVVINGYRLLNNSGDLKLEEFNVILNHKQQGVVFQHEIDHQLGYDGLILNTGREISIW